jgi:RNA polymerase sigma-32 factor
MLNVGRCDGASPRARFWLYSARAMSGRRKGAATLAPRPGDRPESLGQAGSSDEEGGAGDAPTRAAADVWGAVTGGDDDLAEADDLTVAPPVIDSSVAQRQPVLSVAEVPATESADTSQILSDAPAAASPISVSTLAAYLHDLRRHVLLSRDEEQQLAVHFSRTGDGAVARKLITANLRLVVKISQEYGRAHKNLLDLIQEGNIGLIQAVQKYDPYRGVKLSSYAAWWIRAYILKFILTNWRMVKIGTTQAQRKLFFNLRRERDKLEKAGFEVEARHLAAALDVSEREIVEMERRLGTSETSLDAPVRGDEAAGRTQGDLMPAAASTRPDVQVELGEFQELLRHKLDAFAVKLKDRELDIFRDRLLSDAPVTLQVIGERYGISRERARQIEERLKKKLRQFLQSELGDAVGIINQADV